uniref:ATP synthase F0 subunit 8 n=1 Tax=Ornithodoros erraticus TaxID=265619 RepID=UPI002237559A|nr:ATP synthase F0 subunit 8 [Ornithodoros erraticus]UYB78278.1 ATP synthase F0 subunit 8 [Ornithodoros erraticus]UYB78291.1 ATP synthase F0 subunit 8 [Ornithodoros erraticus]
MPQLYPMNWILLCSTFIMMIFFMLTFFYFNPFYMLKPSNFSFQYLQKNWKW